MRNSASSTQKYVNVAERKTTHLPFTGPRKGALGAQHTLFHGPALMRHTIDAYGTRGFANVTGELLSGSDGWLAAWRVCHW